MPTKPKTTAQLEKLTKDFAPKPFVAKNSPNKDYRGEKNGKRI